MSSHGLTISDTIKVISDDDDANDYDDDDGAGLYIYNGDKVEVCLTSAKSL